MPLVFNAFTNPEILITFIVSCVLSILIVVVYVRCRRSAPTSRAYAVSAFGGSTLSNRDVSASKPSNRSKTQAETDAWGSAVGFGIDLGSYNVKSHSFRENRLQELPSVRSVAAVCREGISFGEVEQSLEYAESAFFSLPRDLARPDDDISCRGVAFKPHHATAGMLTGVVGESKISKTPIAVSVAPYLKHVAPQLYLAAHAAGCERFFIFDQSAALITALLRHRATEKHKVRPPRFVVFCDVGRSGISAYICEVRDSAGSVLFSTHRSESLQNMEASMVHQLSKNLTQPDPVTMACIVEAAMEIRDDFASTPEYLAASKKSSTVRIDEHLTVEMQQTTFQELLQAPLQDLDEIAKELETWLKDNTNGREDVELLLTGGSFKLRELRWVFDKYFEPRRTSINKISVSQGLALLAAQQHPAHASQQYDVYPLHLLPTVDEAGVRIVQDTSRGYSVLTPLLRSSSALHRNSSTLNRRSASGSPRASRYSLLN